MVKRVFFYTLTIDGEVMYEKQDNGDILWTDIRNMLESFPDSIIKVETYRGLNDKPPISSFIVQPYNKGIFVI